MRLQYLVAANASLLMLVGVFFWFTPANFLFEGYGFRPEELLDLYGNTTEGNAVFAFGRLLGLVCFGFGLFMFALAPASESSFADRIAFSLLAANLLGFLGSLLQQIAIWVSPLGIITVVLFGLLAVGYGFFLIQGLVGRESTSRGWI